MNRETWERLRTDFGNLHRAIPDFTVGPLHGIYTIEYNVGPETRADILNAFALMTRAGKLLEDVPDELLFPDAPDASDRIRAAEGSERWINFIGYFNADYLDRFREISVGAASTAAIDMLLIRLQNQLVEDVGTVDPVEDDEEVSEEAYTFILPPPLDADDIAILEALAVKPGSLNSLTRLQTKLKNDVRHPLSRKTLSKNLNRLIALGLAARPKTRNKGATLTENGNEIIQHFRASRQRST